MVKNGNDLGVKKASLPVPGEAGCISKGLCSASLFVACDDDFKLTDYESQGKTASGWGDVQENQPDAVSLTGGVLESDPPLLIGGSLHCEGVEVGENDNKCPDFGKNPVIQDNASPEWQLFSCRVDWLSVSVAPETAVHLLEGTVIDKLGNGNNGFRSTEFRQCIGGTCLRKYNPVGEETKLHADWGGYESWEFGGSHGDIYFDLLKDFRCRASRVDIAFDYVVAADYYPKDFINAYRAKIERLGLVVEFKGREREHSCYIGSITSSCRIRIYRKDIEDKTYKRFGAGILRVELELKHKRCHSFWASYVQNGKDYALRLAASYVKHMCGFVALPENLPVIPSYTSRTDSSAIKTLYHVINQFGSVLNLAFRLGVDLPALAAQRAESVSRMSKTRIRRFEREVSELSACEINESLALLLSCSS